jgi:hypothetical protein
MNPLRKVIDGMLIEAAKTTPPGESAAIQCQLVLRFSGPVMGALKRCELTDTDGLYQILAPAMTPDRKQTLAELTFHVDDIVAIGVQRDPSPIAQARGSSLFTPH